MAPEQARGTGVDERADIWAFGAVLFELLTARRVFDGETVSDVLAAVLKSDPDWSALPSHLPPSVRTLLRRCLERNPRNRLHDIAETTDETSFGPVPSPVVRRSRGVWIVVVAVALAGLAAG
jgi:serine/threonine-protein kinase